jgi:hypothetical protein
VNLLDFEHLYFFFPEKFRMKKIAEKTEPHQKKEERKAEKKFLMCFLFFLTPIARNRALPELYHAGEKVAMCM